MSRGFCRGMAIFVEIVVTLIFILLPILAGIGLAEKIGLILLWALSTILMIDAMNGKIWDYAHRKPGDKTKERWEKFKEIFPS